MRKFITIIFFALVVIVAKAQQLPLYSQYIINDYVINPAVGGVRPDFEARSSNRYQWIGIQDAPRTYILSFNGPIKSKNIGVGGYLFNDVTGPTRRTGLYGSYSYFLKLTDKMKLSLGLSGGVLQYAVDGTKISMSDPAADVALNNSLQSVILPDFGFGAYLYDADDKYFAGISMPQLLQNKVQLFNAVKSKFSKLTTDLYIAGGYKYVINDDFTAEPSALIKMAKASPIQLDIGGRAIYKKQIWLGTYLRTKDAVSVLAGYIYKDYLSIGYSYDFTTTNIRKYSTGTHEIMLGMKFK